MATYYVRFDGNDSNDGTCNCAAMAKKTLDAGKALCTEEGDVVYEGDQINKTTGGFPAHTKQGDGSFVKTQRRLPM